MGLLPLEYLKLLLENVCCSLLGDRASNIKKHQAQAQIETKEQTQESVLRSGGGRSTGNPAAWSALQRVGAWSLVVSHCRASPSPKPFAWVNLYLKLGSLFRHHTLRQV